MVVMSANVRIITTLLVVSIILVSALPSALSDISNVPVSSYCGQYSVLNQDLFIAVQPSLYQYYSNLTHTLPHDSDYNRFITPQTVQPIADAILNLTKNKPNPNEEFANAVLDFVHQIPYNITGAMFPVETLVNNQGDCGAVSLLAASIMKAGGLDVVLFKYIGEVAHMNVGVYLSTVPTYHSFLTPTGSFQYDNKTYWTAEATPKGTWRVGDQSIVSPNDQPIIIPLNSSEQTAPGQISCSFTQLSPSSITLDVLPHPQNDQSNRSLVLSGKVTPVTQENQISIYINKGSPGNSYVNVVANASGWYTYAWNLTSDGTYYVSACSSGEGAYAGADSGNMIVFVGPESLMQFQTGSYNYIVGVSLPTGFATRPYMGLTDFLSYPLGCNISVSYSFLVLPTGHSPIGIETKSVTVPESYYTTRDRHGHIQRTVISTKNVTLPVSIPPGKEALALPLGFNQTINSKFCFIFEKNSDGNYQLNAQAFNENDLSNTSESNSNGKNILNITQTIEENTAYKLTTNLSENGITASLQNQNGKTISDSSAQNHLVLLVANNVDSAIVLKDLQIQTGANTVQPKPLSINSPPVQPIFPTGFVAAVIIIAASLIVAGTIINIKQKKSTEK